LLNVSTRMRFGCGAHVCLPEARVVDLSRVVCDAPPSGPRTPSHLDEQDALMFSDANAEPTDLPTYTAVGLLLRLYDGSLAAELAVARACDDEIVISADDLCEWVYQLLVGLSDLHATGGLQGDVCLERVLVRRSLASRPGTLLLDHLAWSIATPTAAINEDAGQAADVAGFGRMLTRDLIPLLDHGSSREVTTVPWVRLLRDLELWCIADPLGTDSAVMDGAPPVRSLLQRFVDGWAALSAFHA
jgi:hypothetical protein